MADEVKRVFEQFGSRSFLGVSWDGLPYASYLGGSVGIMATGSRGSARLALGPPGRGARWLRSA